MSDQKTDNNAEAQKLLKTVEEITLNIKTLQEEEQSILNN